MLIIIGNITFFHDVDTNEMKLKEKLNSIGITYCIVYNKCHNRFQMMKNYY